MEGFTLQGGHNAGFRRTLREMDKAGIVYEVLEPPLDDAMIGQLRDVSDAWLAAKGGHELQFSACCFSPAYLQRNPVAVARDPSGRAIAFANLLITRPGGPGDVRPDPLSPGRHRQPDGVSDPPLIADLCRSRHGLFQPRGRGAERRGGVAGFTVGRAGAALVLAAGRTSLQLSGVVSLQEQVSTLGGSRDTWRINGRGTGPRRCWPTRAWCVRAAVRIADAIAAARLGRVPADRGAFDGLY